MKEDYVSFELAKLLKEKGFTHDMFNPYQLYMPNGQLECWNESPNDIYAPTLQMAMKWLRKEHHLNIIVDCITDKAEARIMTIEDLPTCRCRGIVVREYEEACEAAIKYCLEHLI